MRYIELLTGAKNHPATPAGSGYEADKLSRQHMEAYYHGYFDPIATKDYYGLAGIFYSSHILSDVGPKGGSPVNVRAQLMNEQELAQRKADEAKLAQLDAEIESTLDAQYAQLASSMLPQADNRVKSPSPLR